MPSRRKIKGRPSMIAISAKPGKAKKLFSPKVAKAKTVLALGGKPSASQKKALRSQAKTLAKAAGTRKRKKR